MTQTLILDRCCMAHAMVFAEDPIGKQVAVPTHLERSICEVVDLDILAGQLVGKLTRPVMAAGGLVRGPQLHGMNPYGALARVPEGLAHVEGAECYPHFPGSPTMLGDLVLEPGMTFAFEPSCGFGNHLVTLGGTVIVGDDHAVELNPYTAQLLRVGV